MCRRKKTFLLSRKRLVVNAAGTLWTLTRILGMKTPSQTANANGIKRLICVDLSQVYCLKVYLNILLLSSKLIINTILRHLLVLYRVAQKV